MAQSPITTFTLYTVPFDLSNENVMDFRDSNGNLSEAVRTAYFNSLNHSETFINCQYIRKDTPYNIELLWDNARQYNYIVYDNNEGYGKQYAFITNETYMSDSVTRIEMENDPWQTNLMSLDLGQNYIVREHANRYTSTGAPIYNRIIDVHVSASVMEPINIQAEDGLLFDTSTFGSRVVIIAIILKNNQDVLQGNALLGDPYLTYFTFVKIDDMDMAFTFNGHRLNTIREISKILESPLIVAAYIVPYLPTSANTLGYAGRPLDSDNTLEAVYAWTDYNNDNSTLKNFTVPLDKGTRDISNMSQYALRSESYEPKLLEEPYFSYLLTSEGNGSIKFAPWEMISDSVTIKAGSIVAPDGCTTIVRLGDNTLYNDPTSKNHMIIGKGTLSLPLVTDQYLNYAAYNQSYINGSLPTGLRNDIIGMATGIYGSTASSTSSMGVSERGNNSGGAALTIPIVTNVIGMAQSGMNFMDTIKNMNEAPDGISSNATSFGAAFGTKLYGGVAGLYKKRLPDATRKQLFDYYAMCGYMVNVVKEVNMYSRYWYNYLQLSNTHLEGVPELDERMQLETIFNRGVTIWHMHPNLENRWRDYRYENKEITWG